MSSAPRSAPDASPRRPRGASASAADPPAADDTTRALAGLAALATTVTGASLAVFARLDGARNEMLAASGITSAAATRLLDGIRKRLPDETKPVVFRATVTAKGTVTLVAGQGYVAAVSVPAGGSRLVLLAAGRDAQALLAGHLTSLSAVAQQGVAWLDAAAAIHELRRQAEERRRRETALVESQARFELLSSLATGALSAPTTADVLAVALRQLAHVFPAVRVVYAVLDGAGTMHVAASVQPDGMSDVAGATLDLSRAGKYTETLHAEGLVIAEDIHRDARLEPLVAQLDAAGTGAVLEVALPHPTGRLGVLACHAPASREWLPGEISMLIDAADYVAVALRDADEREERLRAEAALRESEERFRRLSDASSDGVAITEDGRVREVNQAFCRMFGYDEADVIGKPVVEFSPLPAKEEIIQREMTGGEGTYETLGLRRDGGVFDLEITGKTVTLGGRTARVIVLRDISVRKEVDKLKREFVSTVSHELRSPLTSIRGALGLLEAGAVGALTTRARDLVSIGRANAERLLRLIDDILDLEKIEAGKLELRLMAVDPLELARTTLDGIRSMADHHHIRLRQSVVCRASIQADRDRLIQVLTNLVSNAIKFSPEGESVTLSVMATERGRVRFEVEDHGPGIQPSQRERLFQRFQQLDASDRRPRGGTGLGLAISRSIVEEHGGEIGVESQPGWRTVFWFEVPVLPGSASSTTPVTSGAGDRPLALLATSDDELARMLGVVLSRDGYDVVHAGSADEAEARLGDRMPDAVALDVGLGDGAGLALLERLRRRRGAEDVPVIALGARGADGEMAHPFVIDWMGRPMDERRLLRIVRRTVRRAGAPRLLLADASRLERPVAAARLRSRGLEVLEASDASEALHLLRETTPDLAVLDAELPGAEAGALVAALRREHPALPLVIQAPRELGTDERRALAASLVLPLSAARVTASDAVEAARLLLETVLDRAPLS